MPLQEPEAGPTWKQRAALPGDASVLDPNDTTGRASAFINAIQRRSIARVLPRARPLTTLDFGCGSGRLTQWLRDEGFDVFGVDAETEMLTAARRRDGDARLVGGDGSALPFREGAFEAAFSVGVLQYFTADARTLQRPLAELKRVLQPGGTLILVEQICDGTLGRGAPLAHYLEAITAVGMRIKSTGVVRRSDAWTARIAARVPVLMRQSFMPRLVSFESQARRDQLRGKAYADELIVAEIPPS